MRLLAALIVFSLVYGCLDVAEDSSLETMSTTSTTTLIGPLPSLTTTTLDLDAVCSDWVKPPEAGCECVSWDCPSQSTAVTSTHLVTTTTCVLVLDEDYIPDVVYDRMTIRNNKFRPSNIDVNVGDVLFVEVLNKQGLHKIRDTYSNETILLGPGDTYMLTFYAEEEGSYLLTCNPYCEEAMEATITVERPYTEVC